MGKGNNAPLHPGRRLAGVRCRCEQVYTLQLGSIAPCGLLWNVDAVCLLLQHDANVDSEDELSSMILHLAPCIEIMLASLNYGVT